VSPSTAHSTSSDARRALGRDADGRFHLPRGVELRLGNSVTTDVDRFSSLAGTGDPRSLLHAMQLVRGPLLGGLHRTDWAVFDGTQSEMEALVVRTALRGADAFVSLGGGEEAEWMVRQALLVSPYDERLYRALLVATAAQGNRVGLRSAMAQLRTLAGEGTRPPARTAVHAPAECLHPATTALYRDLLRGSPAAGGHPVRL
jgi:DNA-binding SARP family transcriptional activator